ncbi:MAG TPA: 50S ribosomal protein L11 methyltransferase [Tenuifilaceae bacterium]|nr:50S ribosomal protein L11 methyltransferase [Tenuifilaceae bacterium]
MNYYKVKFTITPYSQQNAEILVALLADMQFDSFEDFNQGIFAYIPEQFYNSHGISTLINEEIFLGISIDFQAELIENQNWNKKWESNFVPVCVENLCRIRAPFHGTESGFALEITIEPKMSFGTGHHQTTWLMVRELFNLEVQGKAILDMGCGTGVLGIVAEKLGAAHVVAIDNDQWAFDNAQENALKNGCSSIDTLLGDASLLKDKYFDIILANINLNTLVNDMPIYNNSLSEKGILIVSGILKSDVMQLNRVAESISLKPFVQRHRDDWALVGYEKI